jgi:hypothetical protein
MTRIWKLCVLSSTLAVLALATNGASAVEVKVTTPPIILPKVVTVHSKMPQPLGWDVRGRSGGGSSAIGSATGGGGSGKASGSSGAAGSPGPSVSGKWNQLPNTK